jgi:predicted transcriptional regulator
MAKLVQRGGGGDAGRLLTEVELELMTILWRLGEGTVRDVMAELPDDRDLAYTSVSTVLRILEQKGFVKSTASGRTHVYGPAVAKPQYESRNLRHLVGRLFEGDPASLVRRLVDATPLSKDDLRELRDLLDEKLER